MFKKLKLKTKIIFSIFVSAVILSILTAAGVYFYLGNTLVNEKLKETDKLITEQVHESRQILDKNEVFVKTIATQEYVKEYLQNPDEKKRLAVLKIFSDYASTDPKYLSLYLLNTKGIALLSTDPSFVGQDYSFRVYYTEGMAGRPSVDLLLGKMTNRFGYFFSHPVFDEKGKVLGIFVVKITGDEINSAIIESEIGRMNTVMLVDKYGVIIASNKPERFLKSLGNLSIEEKKQLQESKKFLDTKIIPLQYDAVQKALRIGSSTLTLTVIDAEDNDTEVVHVDKIEDSPFYLITEIRLGVVNNTVLHILAILLGFMLFGIVLSTAINYWLLSTALSPLKRFKEFAEGISSGDFSKTIDLKTDDELMDVAKTLNGMSKNLKDLYENLGARVEEQTQEIRKKAKDLNDQKVAILNILEDVEKEKRRSEALANDLEKFKQAVENASDQIVIADAEGTVVYGNKILEKITGYTPEEAIGKKAGTLWKKPMPPEYYAHLWNTIKVQKKTFIGEIENKRKNGEIYTAVISISPIFNKQGDIVYFVALERDITKEKEIDKAKTEFVSLASHQLRTPLSAINWYTEMLLSGDAGKITKEQKKFLEEVYRGNQRMVDLVNALLNVSRLDLGTFIIEPASTDVAELIQSVLGELRFEIKKRKLSVSTSFGTLPDPFLADQKLFRMVIQNLLSNAVKYTSTKGTVTIVVDTHSKGDALGGRFLDEDSLVVSVTDSGIGIPVGEQDKIFSKLFRATNARESETEGTGLGLYMVKSIIDESGGKVWFVSEEKKGSTFYVALSVDGMKKKEGSKKLD